MHGHGVNISDGRRWLVEGDLSATILIDFSHEEVRSMHTTRDDFSI